MIITIIAAMAQNLVIGRNGRIPWDIPADRRHFRELTMGHPVVMGRKTFEGIGGALPGRQTIVLTRRAEYRAPGCVVVPDLAAALGACAAADEVFICGGEELYREALARADRIQLTVIHRDFAGDARFPEMPATFAEVEREEVAGPVPYAFVLYERQ
jgi:dihydrofolate reductase